MLWRVLLLALLGPALARGNCDSFHAAALEQQPLQAVSLPHALQDGWPYAAGTAGSSLRKRRL